MEDLQELTVESYQFLYELKSINNELYEKYHKVHLKIDYTSYFYNAFDGMLRQINYLEEKIENIHKYYDSEIKKLNIKLKEKSSAPELYYAELLSGYSTEIKNICNKIPSHMDLIRENKKLILDIKHINDKKCHTQKAVIGKLQKNKKDLENTIPVIVNICFDIAISDKKKNTRKELLHFFCNRCKIKCDSPTIKPFICKIINKEQFENWRKSLPPEYVDNQDRSKYPFDSGKSLAREQ
jgi:hypothetical protein